MTKSLNRYRDGVSELRHLRPGTLWEFSESDLP